MKNVPGPSGEPPLLAYPLRYTFKVMGLAAEDFADHARRLVERSTGSSAAEVSVRQSAGGKYHSASVVVELSSEEQRRAVYQALHGDARVVFYL